MNILLFFINFFKRLDYILYDLVIFIWMVMKDNKKVGYNVKLIILKKGLIIFYMQILLFKIL